MYRENLKNKVIQREEFNVKENHAIRFGSNESLSGLIKNDIEWRQITDGLLMKYETRGYYIYRETGKRWINKSAFVFRICLMTV